VNEEVGLTFAKALRSFLRQDPDIILVGEIRDLETAQIAVQASLTGHLGAFDAAHQRRAELDHPSRRPRDRAVPADRDDRGRGGSAAGAVEFPGRVTWACS
jgi:hypothetical protein